MDDISTEPSATSTKEVADVSNVDPPAADDEPKLDSQDDVPASPGTEQKISKRAQKRLLKEAKYLETKAERKRMLKEKDREKQRQKKEEIAKLRAAGVPKPEQVRPEPSSARIVIDCDFNDLMTVKELGSMAKQITYCYSKNRAARHPMQLAVLGFRGNLESLLTQRQPSWQSWKMQFDTKTYLDFYPPEDKAKMIYLTADSPNLIEDLDEDKIYVIGGIVDRNRHKELCYNRALEQGISHGRLKIDHYIQMKGRAVLTVDQVFEIMSKYLDSRNWETAFWAVIPHRKELKAKHRPSGAPGSTVNSDAGANPAAGSVEEPGNEDDHHDEEIGEEGEDHVVQGDPEPEA